MKTLKQILKESDTLQIRENINSKELVEMVELGLLEKEKLPMLERAMAMDAELLSEAEKNILVDMLNSLIAERASISKSFSVTSAGNPKQTDYVSDAKVPVIITFKRRSIRVFPNSIKIALYYSPQLDKYISIPFGEKSAETLGTNINEAWTAGRQMNTKQRNTYKMDPDEEDVYDKLERNVGSKAASDYRSNIDRDKDNQYKREALKKARTTRQLSRLSGGYREGLRRAERKYGGYSPISASVAKGVHTAKWLGSKLIDKLQKEETESTFEKNLAEARVKRARVKSPTTVQNKARRGQRKFSSKTKKLWKARPFRSKSATTSVGRKKKYAIAEPLPNKLERHTQIYRKAQQNYEKASSRQIQVYDPKTKGQKLVNSKEHYKKIADYHAKKIKEHGGTVPHVASRKKVKRTPGVKPPPALAEGVFDWIGKTPLTWAAKKALGLFKSDSNNDKQFNKNDNDPDREEDRFTRKRRGETKGTGTVVGSNRVTPGASELAAWERQSRKKATTTQESALNIIKSLAESKEGGKSEINFDGNTVTINSRIARKVLAIYESLNKTNKKNMEKMLDESVSSFRKVINFAIRQ